MKHNKIEFTVPKTPEGISECINKTIEALHKYQVERKTVMLFSMRLEELLLYLSSDQWKTENTIRIQIRKLLDEVSIRILLKGEQIDLPEPDGTFSLETENLLLGNENEIKVALNEMIISSALNQISVRYHEHTNDIILYVQRSKYEQLKSVLIAIVLGLLSGFLMKTFLPEEAVSYIAGNILTTVTNMFMNGIKMLVGPLVFCSVVSCISEHSNFAMLEKIGKFTLAHYFLDAFLAILLAIGICYLTKPGAFSVAPVLYADNSAALVETAGKTTVSLWKTIQDIVPSNIFASFHNSTILQIIFIAILFGVALSQIGVHCEQIRNNIKGLYKVFNKMMSFIMLFLPVMVFCSMAQISIKFGLSTMKDILQWLALIFAAYLIMIVLYSLMVWIRTGRTPVEYFKKILPCLLVAFTMGSSNAAMSTTMETCEKQLGINKKICSFTIPLGVSIHCASSCIFYIISTVFLYNLYKGADMLGTLDIIFYFSVFLLALGAPSVSGSGPICVAMLLSSIGVPMYYISLILAWDPIVSTIKTACSCMEDLSVSCMVAADMNLPLPKNTETGAEAEATQPSETNEPNTDASEANTPSNDTSEANTPDTDTSEANTPNTDTSEASEPNNVKSDTTGTNK